MHDSAHKPANKSHFMERKYILPDAVEAIHVIFWTFFIAAHLSTPAVNVPVFYCLLVS
jgi:hypothetical protein